MRVPRMPMVHIDMRGTLHMVAWADGESVGQHLVATSSLLMDTG